MYASTFVILSPADYQNILAELQSPAALQPAPHFLQPELPVTPNLSPAHHQHHHYPEIHTPMLADSQPQPLPWSTEIEQDEPPRSPPRPCELTLSFPAFELPDTVPSKVRKPHIALNDQLLLSEEEDRFCQEMELSCKPKSTSLPAMCKLDTDTVFSTSSLSISSTSLGTPSSPEKVKKKGRVQICFPNGVQENIAIKEGKKEVTMEIDKVVEVVAPEREGNGFVEKWLEMDLIKNVERKCEMIIKDSSKWEEENNILLEQREASSEKNQLVLIQDENKGTASDVKVIDVHNMSGELEGIGSEFENNGDVPVVKKYTNEIREVERVHGDSEEKAQSDRKDDAHKNLRLKVEEGLLVSQSDVCGKAEMEKVAKDQAVASLSPQAWVEALGESYPSDSGSNEEEEEAERDKELTEGSLSEELEKGSEEKEDGKEMTMASVEEILDQIEQTEKRVCSLLGWHSDSSSVNVEPPTPGRSVSSDLLDRRER